MRLRPGHYPGFHWGSLRCAPNLLTGFGEGNREGIMERAWEGKETERKGWKREKRERMEIRGKFA